MHKSILNFKSNFPNLTVLKIHSQDIVQLKEHVRKKIRQAPMMFIGMQIVIDLSDFDNNESLTFSLKEFKEFLQNESINPVAVMSNNNETQKIAVEFGLGALPILVANNASKVSDNDNFVQVEEKITAPSDEPQEIVTTEVSVDEPRKTFESDDDSLGLQEAEKKQINQQEDCYQQGKTIRHSIRSGQSIYSKGDLTIIGSVSHGAEVIADGNIHIYGTLRGRAIAGAHGNTKACIFCQNLDAELIAIAGSYTQIEDTKNDYLGKTVQISFENEKICFFPL